MEDEGEGVPEEPLPRRPLTVSMANGNLISDKSVESLIMHVTAKVPDKETDNANSAAGGGLH